MRRGDKENGARLRNPPGATRDDLAEEQVDQVAEDGEEHVVLPVDHGIQLFLRPGCVVRRSGLAGRAGLLLGLGGHGCSVVVSKTIAVVVYSVDVAVRFSGGVASQVGCWFQLRICGGKKLEEVTGVGEVTAWEGQSLKVPSRQEKKHEDALPTWQLAFRV